MEDTFPFNLADPISSAMTDTPFPFPFVDFDLGLPQSPKPPPVVRPDEPKSSSDNLPQKYAALQDSHRDLLSEFLKMKSKNDYLMKLLHYLEKGVAMRKAELETLKKENQRLKVLPRPTQSFNIRITLRRV
jgi:hypothetical protein